MTASTIRISLLAVLLAGGIAALPAQGAQKSHQKGAKPNIILQKKSPQKPGAKPNIILQKKGPAKPGGR